jgi:hypothetical protein
MYSCDNRRVLGLLANNMFDTIIRVYIKIPPNWNTKKHVLYKYLIVQLTTVIYSKYGVS